MMYSLFSEKQEDKNMLYNDPKAFRDEMIKGYVKAYSQYVTEVPGGVVRSTKLPEGKIVVMNGGGSGHFPAFCGIVGDGFMDATVVGNIFTSPSTDDVYHVAKAIDNGTGIYIIGGNYAGDKMNFNLARDRLKAEGIDCRSFYITDDIHYFTFVGFRTTLVNNCNGAIKVFSHISRPCYTAMVRRNHTEV